MSLRTFALAAVAMLAATQAAATIDSFATWAPSSGNGNNVALVNSGTGGNNNTFRSNGTGASIYTVATPGNVNTNPTATSAVGVAGTFSFLNLNPVIAQHFTNLDSSFTFTGTSASAAVVQNVAGINVLVQPDFNGSFTITYTGVTKNFTIGGNTYTLANGSTLLAGTYSTGPLAGVSGDFSAKLSASTQGGTVTFTSPWLNFGSTVQRELAVNMTGLVSRVNGANIGLNRVSGRGTRSFRATAQAQFSSDPAPTSVIVVPEPATWGMMILGFGLVGVARRRRAAAVAA